MTDEFFPFIRVESIAENIIDKVLLKTEEELVLRSQRLIGWVNDVGKVLGMDLGFKGLTPGKEVLLRLEVGEDSGVALDTLAEELRRGTRGSGTGRRCR